MIAIKCMTQCRLQPMPCECFSFQNHCITRIPTRVHVHSFAHCILATKQSLALQLSKGSYVLFRKCAISLQPRIADTSMMRQGYQKYLHPDHQAVLEFTSKVNLLAQMGPFSSFCITYSWISYVTPAMYTRKGTSTQTYKSLLLLLVLSGLPIGS